MFSIAPAGFGASTLSGLSGTGALASSAGAGAGAGGFLAGLGPWGAAAAGLNLGAQAIGGVMEQKAADKAIEEANKNLIRTVGIQEWMRDREQGKQMAALREGNYFMQSPIAQQNKESGFAEDFMLAGQRSFSPYLVGMASRFR
jgi:hypothetical protein